MPGNEIQNSFLQDLTTNTNHHIKGKLNPMERKRSPIVSISTTKSLPKTSIFNLQEANGEIAFSNPQDLLRKTKRSTKTAPCTRKRISIKVQSSPKPPTKKDDLPTSPSPPPNSTSLPEISSSSDQQSNNSFALPTPRLKLENILIYSKELKSSIMFDKEMLELYIHICGLYFILEVGQELTVRWAIQSTNSIQSLDSQSEISRSFSTSYRKGLNFLLFELPFTPLSLKQIFSKESLSGAISIALEFNESDASNEQALRTFENYISNLKFVPFKELKAKVDFLRRHLNEAASEKTNEWMMKNKMKMVDGALFVADSSPHRARGKVSNCSLAANRSTYLKRIKPRLPERRRIVKSDDDERRQEKEVYDLERNLSLDIGKTESEGIIERNFESGGVDCSLAEEEEEESKCSLMGASEVKDCVVFSMGANEENDSLDSTVITNEDKDCLDSSMITNEVNDCLDSSLTNNEENDSLDSSITNNQTNDSLDSPDTDDLINSLNTSMDTNNDSISHLDSPMNTNDSINCLNSSTFSNHSIVDSSQTSISQSLFESPSPEKASNSAFFLIQHQNSNSSPLLSPNSSQSPPSSMLEKEDFSLELRQEPQNSSLSTPALMEKISNVIEKPSPLTTSPTTSLSTKNKITSIGEQILFTWPLEPLESGNKTTIFQRDLRRLEPFVYLNDSLLQFYLIHLEQTLSCGNSVHFFNTHFYSTLKAKGASAVAKWCKKDLFERDFWIVPINEKLHWYVAIVCYAKLALKLPAFTFSRNLMKSGFGTTHIAILNSLSGYNSEGELQVGKQLSNFIYQIAAHFEFTTKRNHNFETIFPRDLPQQTNLHDCGCFLLQNIQAFLENSAEASYKALKKTKPQASFANWYSVRQAIGKRNEIRGLIEKTREVFANRLSLVSSESESEDDIQVLTAREYHREAMEID